MDKRRLAYTLLLVGITFVALLHTALAFAFDTGLESIGILVAGLGVAGVLFVNVAMPTSSRETGSGPDERGPATGPDGTAAGADDSGTGSD